MATSMVKQRLYGMRELKKRRRLVYVKNASFQSYIRKMLHMISDTMDASISEQALKIVDTIIMDLFMELATEAMNLMTAAYKRTLSEWEIQSAVIRKLPGEIAKHALCEGEKAKRMYINMHSQRRLDELGEDDSDG
ncbi:unnamed protein product [Larinioides sclopetarius]|uniref:Core Histone H2A/H2B/H3 domain-containing protein n=1 Tax=Larinioides sclopetarius TaxID=280406 RepID=A0AAV2BWE4_9ARAC